MADDAERTRWIVHGERLIYDNRWIRLGMADVEIPGVERFEHHVVHLDRAAIAVVVDERDRALMMWRHRFVFDRWGWELPGGLVDAGEDAMTTAVREVEEETGYRPKEVEHLVTYQPMAGMVDSEHMLFLARGAELVAEPTGEVEADIIEWIPMSEIPAIIARGDIWTSGTLIGLYAARDRLNAARSTQHAARSTQHAADGSGEFVDPAALPAGAGHGGELLGALDVGLGGFGFPCREQRVGQVAPDAGLCAVIGAVHSGEGRA